MTQDFAKIRPEPLLEKKPVNSPPAWSLMITGMVLGIAIGVFACVLLYLSGRVPPLEPLVAANNFTNNGASSTSQDTGQKEEPALELEFYTELPNYEVPVDATPVDISSQDPERELETQMMLQAGAFERRDLAETEMRRQQALGLTVQVKTQNLVGRTLFLVQSGPYTTNGEFESAKQVLRRNNISFMPSAVR